MHRLERYLNKQRKVLKTFKFFELLFELSIFFCAWLQLGFLCRSFLSGIRALYGIKDQILVFIVLVGAGASLFWLWRQRFRVRFSWTQVAESIERGARYFKIEKQDRSELVSAASFLETSGQGESSELRAAHMDLWAHKIGEIQKPLKPFPSLWAKALLGSWIIVSSVMLVRWSDSGLPTRLVAWTPREFDMQLPFDGASWKQESGALSGVAGAFVRFEAPSYGWRQVFLYVREGEKIWQAIPCETYCAYQLKESGKYAVGTLWSRSSFFPLQVAPDEPPKSAIFAKQGPDLLSSLALEVANAKNLQIQMTASDDVLIRKIDILHRFENEESVLRSYVVNDRRFKKDDEVSLENWKGGQHEIFVRAYDDRQSSNSAPLIILFSDEELMKKKQLQDLRALLDSWIHILGDLLESNADNKVASNLILHLNEMAYPEAEAGSLLAAYTKELQLLQKRIEAWVRSSASMEQVPDLVRRTEKQILYGLSLIFQEKTGDLASTSRDLKGAQDRLQDLLKQMKDGKTDLSSEELQKAFENLMSKIEELQDKIKNLPQGPQDDLLNREALNEQVDQSQELADKIAEIQKQIAGGDSKGAMRELESLLNQLSILSKEMERSLEQWQDNMDRGAMQAMERYSKQLADLQKEEEELLKQTQKLKDRVEAEESKNQREWKPKDQKTADRENKEFEKLAKQQEAISKKMNELAETYEKSLEGTEFKEALRSSEVRELEESIKNQMSDSGKALRDQKGFEATSHEQESIELMKKAQKKQQSIKNQIQAASQPSAARDPSVKEKIDLQSSEGRGEKERRRKIMDSLRQKVDERFQDSHERYFEELLQR